MEYKKILSLSYVTIILTSDGQYLTGLWFTTSRFKKIKEEQLNEKLEIFKITKNWLDRYFIH